MIQRKMSVETAIDFLNSYQHENAIRDLLQSDGIRGVPKQGDRCPLSNWILKHTGERVEVDLFYFHWQQMVPLSRSLQNFVEKVDQYQYPEISYSYARCLATRTWFWVRFARRHPYLFAERMILRSLRFLFGVKS